MDDHSGSTSSDRCEPTPRGMAIPTGPEAAIRGSPGSVGSSAGQTLTSTNVKINISFTDNLITNYCSYNITNSQGGIVVSDNNITCGENSVEYQTIAEGSNYILTAFVNDTSGNINITNRTVHYGTNIYFAEPEIGEGKC